MSYRDLEEITTGRGVRVDHVTLNRWVVKYSPIVAARVQSKKRPTLKFWRMDQSYLRVRGKWMYLYRAIDKAGNTLDFILSERRNGLAATRFFAKALSSNGIPDKIVIDRSGVNGAGIREVSRILKRFGCPVEVQTIRSKFLSNMIEQDHRFIKRRVRHMCGFKPSKSASATLDGIEVANTMPPDI